MRGGGFSSVLTGLQMESLSSSTSLFEVVVVMVVVVMVVVVVEVVVVEVVVVVVEVVVVVVLRIHTV